MEEQTHPNGERFAFISRCCLIARRTLLSRVHSDPRRFATPVAYDGRNKRGDSTTRTKVVERTPPFDARPSLHIICDLAPGQGKNTGLVSMAYRISYFPSILILCCLEQDQRNSIVLSRLSPNTENNISSRNTCSSRLGLSIQRNKTV